MSIKRYKARWYSDEDKEWEEPAYLVEDDEGDWVRYKDVPPALDEAYMKGQNFLNDRMPWVSVEDELPEDGDECVIVYSKEHGVSFEANDLVKDDNFVTHWQPLPDAPE